MLDTYELTASLLKRALAVVLTMRPTHGVTLSGNMIAHLEQKGLEPLFLDTFNFYVNQQTMMLVYAEPESLAIIESPDGALHTYKCEVPQEAIVRYVFEKDTH